MAVAILDLDTAWRRSMHAGEAVFEKARRAADALQSGHVDYAMIGGNAVATWVATRDEGAIRYTRDVDILLRKEDLPLADAAMQAAGFVRVDVAGIPIYLDGPDGLPSRGVHVIIANEKVKPDDPVPAPDVSESEQAAQFRVLNLEALVRMKLVAHRLKDRTHLTDMVQVGLIDQSWPAKYQPPLRERLQAIVDNPDG
jgi:hypothetical protein